MPGVPPLELLPLTLTGVAPAFFVAAPRPVGVVTCLPSGGLNPLRGAVPLGVLLRVGVAPRGEERAVVPLGVLLRVGVAPRGVLLRVGVAPCGEERALDGVPTLGGVPVVPTRVGVCLVRECLIGSARVGVPSLLSFPVFVVTIVSFLPLP